MSVFVEKEYYRRKIIEMVCDIERKDLLEFLYTFVKHTLIEENKSRDR